MNKRWLLLCLVPPLQMLAPAHAQDQATLHIKALAATCAACHGTGGQAIEGAAVPGLAGMQSGYMLDQLKAFKEGRRPATVMHQLAKGYTDSQIEQLAAYFAAQPR
jgi:cytochrome c553